MAEGEPEALGEIMSLAEANAPSGEQSLWAGGGGGLQEPLRGNIIFLAGIRAPGMSHSMRLIYFLLCQPPPICTLFSAGRSQLPYERDCSHWVEQYILLQGLTDSGTGTSHCKSSMMMLWDGDVSTTGAQPLTH